MAYGYDLWLMVMTYGLWHIHLVVYGLVGRLESSVGQSWFNPEKMVLDGFQELECQNHRNRVGRYHVYVYIDIIHDTILSYTYTYILYGQRHFEGLCVDISMTLTNSMSI